MPRRSYFARVKDVDFSKETWLTAQNGLLFVNKCVFVSKPQAVEVKNVAAEILAVIKDQLASGAAGVAGSVPPQDETERKINLVASYANGVIR